MALLINYASNERCVIYFIKKQNDTTCNAKGFLCNQFLF